MSKQTINIGASPNDGTGTPLRTSFDYTNQNFTELYTALGGGVGLPGATTQVIFNDGGTNLAGDAGLVYNKTTDALTVAGLVTAGSAAITGDLTVDTSTLKVDSTNNRVGIGTASPTNKLSLTVTPPTADTDGLIINGPSSRQIIAGITGATYSFAGVGANQNLIYAGNGQLNIIGDGQNVRIGTSASSYVTLDTSANFNVGAGNVVMATSGKGIDFSATANSSGTMTSELLNDYEEGTWTPTQGAGLTVVGAFSSSGTYTKVGRSVYITGQVDGATSVTAASGILCGGLPFSAAQQAAATAVNSPFNAGSFCAINAADLYAVTAMAGTTSIRFSATYIV